ncbi:MAG: tripartite tricarboxylate transporter substrate binding protein [Betaproteobacteria bacterium]|nr:tripartite tricarboxylate transporter substrate binding protein [Betaproteobacteria bacterium]
MKTTHKILGLFLALAFVFAAGESAAQAYPNKPIKIVVGFQPGGGTDVTTRLVATKLSDVLGQPIIVENKPGAEARISTEYVAKAAPDGYTLLAGASGQMVFNPGLFAPLPYDHENAFVPITLLNSDPLVFAVNPSLPVHSVKDLVALAKAKPGTLFHASAASAFFVAAEFFNKQAGVKIIQVPYKGAAPAVVAAVSGEASMIVMSVPPINAMMKAGKLRPIAVTGDKRSRFLPEIPTVLESGLDFEGITWAGLFAPAGTPSAVIDKLYGGLAIVLKEDSMMKRLVSIGHETSGTGMPPAEFAIFFKKELAKWTKAIKDMNIRG